MRATVASRASERDLWLRRHQRTTFLLASGLSTTGSFAGLTAKGWVLMDGTGSPMLLALHFALLSLPTILVSGPAGVLTDRVGCEQVLVRAQLGLFLSAVLGAVAVFGFEGPLQVSLLLLSSLVMGMAGSFELTARNKYTALLVDRPEQLAPYLASFSVVFNVGKLVGPPLGGWLVALTGPAMALAIDATSYIFPIISVIWLLKPNRSNELRSGVGSSASLWSAWKRCGRILRHVFRFTALACLVGFFHPGLAPYIASQMVGPSPQALGTFTSVLAAGSIVGGLALRGNSNSWAQRPGLLMGGCALVTALAQIGMAGDLGLWWSLAMTFVIGAGTACLLTGVNLISQVGAPMELRGRMAALGQMSFLGAGGISGLLAAAMAGRVGLMPTFGILGSAGLGLALWELGRRRGIRLRSGAHP